MNLRIFNGSHCALHLFVRNTVRIKNEAAIHRTRRLAYGFSQENHMSILRTHNSLIDFSPYQFVCEVLLSLDLYFKSYLITPNR